ncbi:hypothetical protein Dimus_031619 [Dionaea muscipula]
MLITARCSPASPRKAAASRYLLAELLVSRDEGSPAAGGFDTALAVTRAYDRATIKFRAVDADINFDIGDYEDDLNTGFASGSSKFRGVNDGRLGRGNYLARIGWHVSGHNLGNSRELWNMVPRFGKRDTTSFMDLTYMEYMTAKLPINLPRLMIRHMAYVISVPSHELPFGDLLNRVFEAFEVPLSDKEGEDPIKTDFFEETFINMCQLKREDIIWWLGTGANRRRDDVEVEAENADIPTENVEAENEEVHQEENEETDFVWEQVEEVEPEAQVQGEIKETEVETEDPCSGEKFFDVMDGIDERYVNEDVPAPAVRPLSSCGQIS